ncbi:MAG: nucleolar RNA-binding Nop10p family protein [Promethearchaeota archaeon]
MVKYLMKCPNCGEYRLYNPEMKCKKCGCVLINPRPAKFSLIDKYGKHRLQYFKEKYPRPPLEEQSSKAK